MFRALLVLSVFDHCPIGLPAIYSWNIRCVVPCIGALGLLVSIHIESYGNDDIEQAVEMIFDLRIKAQKISEAKLISNLKQYP